MPVEIMDNLVKLNSQTAGRDRLMRLFQYGSMLLQHLLERGHLAGTPDKDSLNKLRNLELACSSGRKLLRFGRCLDTFYGAFTSVNLNDVILRLTLTLSKINQALFLFTDHILWAARVGLAQVDKDKWAQRSAKFWFFSIVLNLARDFYEILHLVKLELSNQAKRQRWAASNNQSPASSSSPSCNQDLVQVMVSRMREHPDVVVDTLKNGCDVWIPMTTLGYVKLSPGVVGFLGVVSSLASITALLNPVMKLQPQ